MSDSKDELENIASGRPGEMEATKNEEDRANARDDTETTYIDNIFRQLPGRSDMVVEVSGDGS